MLDLPFGAVLGTVNLDDCVCFTEDFFNGVPGHDDDERQYGDFTPGRFGFMLSDVRRFKVPIPARGSLNFWDWTPPPNLEYL